MAIWSVSIVPAAQPGGLATFVAQNQPNAAPGSITVAPADVVSWNNTTTDPHCISVLADPTIQPTDPDNPGYVAPGHQTGGLTVPNPPPATFKYNCLIQTGITGTIDIV